MMQRERMPHSRLKYNEIDTGGIRNTLLAKTNEHHLALIKYTKLPEEYASLLSWII